MHVDIIIPTVDRIPLLRDTVKSIKGSTYKDVTMIGVLDGNQKILHEMIGLFKDHVLLINETRRDWVFSMNRAIKEKTTDAVIYASDDLVFPPHLIAKLVATHQEVFPDGDGLLGIKQSVKGCSSAFGLIGRKFIDHFPDGQVFCPDFIHYSSDFELGRYARVNNKFHFYEPTAVIHHRRKDSTFQLAKRVRDRDYKVMAERRGRGLVWGNGFERVT